MILPFRISYGTAIAPAYRLHMQLMEDKVQAKGSRCIPPKRLLNKEF